MKLKSAHRTLWLWIAVCAVLLNAFAPAVSHAIAFSKGVPPSWEICRSDGARVTFSGAFNSNLEFKAALPDTGGKLVQAGKSGKPVQPGKSLGLMAMDGDCAYCVTHAGSFGLPPSAVAGLVLAGSKQLHPFLFYRSPQPLAVWSAARPRGPPVLV